MSSSSFLCHGSTSPGISCQPGLLDCCALHGSMPLQCATYENILRAPSELKWVLILSFVTMALMAFGIGANDAANNWGTSVGSGAVPLRWVLLIGGLMDWLGAATLGHGVPHPLSHVQYPMLIWVCSSKMCDVPMQTHEHPPAATARVEIEVSARHCFPQIAGKAYSNLCLQTVLVS